MAANEISTATRAAQLRAVFRQMPIALAVNLVNAALTAVVLLHSSGRPLPLFWFVAVALVTAAVPVLIAALGPARRAGLAARTRLEAET